MAPTLRSTSAQNSPARISTTRSVSPSPATTPTRKTPLCSKCKRSRVGHPRSGCPFVDSATVNTSHSGSPANPSHLTDALGSMVIDNPDTKDGKTEDSKTAGRRPRRSSARPIVRSDTLLSLSANSQEILQRLSQPGILSDNDDKLTESAKIVRWQDMLGATPAPVKRAKLPTRSPMPGSLIPPSPESSFASSSGQSYNMKRESPSANSLNSGSDPQRQADGGDTEDEHSSASESTTSTRRAAPLTRTMSSVEREEFVSRLSGEAPATIYIIPKANVDAVITQARSLKFITELVMNDDDQDPNALIILGREGKSVQNLLLKIEKENSKARVQDESPSKGQSRLKAAAGAVVVGAVGAWAGLAFT